MPAASGITTKFWRTVDGEQAFSDVASGRAGPRRAGRRLLDPARSFQHGRAATACPGRPQRGAAGRRAAERPADAERGRGARAQVQPRAPQPDDGAGARARAGRPLAFRHAAQAGRFGRLQRAQQRQHPARHRLGHRQALAGQPLHFVRPRAHHQRPWLDLEPARLRRQLFQRQAERRPGADRRRAPAQGHAQPDPGCAQRLLASLERAAPGERNPRHDRARRIGAGRFAPGRV